MTRSWPRRSAWWPGRERRRRQRCRPGDPGRRQALSAPFTLAWRAQDGLGWLAWEGAGVSAAFPTRAGGVSPAPFSSLNLGLTVGDEPDNVLANRRRLCTALGLATERLVVMQQVHGTTLRWVGETEAGAGAADAATALPACDGQLTAAAGLGLCVSTADCLPLVIVAATPDGVALAAVHAGWRGVLAGIAGQAAAALAARGRLLGAVVGPGIGPCCFAVAAGLRARFAARFPGVAGARTVDLWAAARADLVAAGVPATDTTVAGVCTACDLRFFSHRRERGLTGRHLTIAWRHV